MRLTAHYEVVDAELAAILMVLRETAQKEDAGARRCLIMSDSASALRMIEHAWRARGRGTYAMGDRGSMLEAICTYREQVELVVLVYVPAHRGFSGNSYADAAAKACTEGEIGEISRMIREEVKWRKYVTEIEVEGKWEIWDKGTYGMMKEALGWWVVQEEAGRGENGRILDMGRLGPKWQPHTADRNTRVWASTGAGIPRTRDSSGGSATADTDECCETDEAARVGIAMAARQGNAWTVAHDSIMHARKRHEEETGTEGPASRTWQKGCPGCCSRAHGWRWQGAEDAREWRGPRGEHVTAHATTMHVLGGQCKAVEHRAAEVDRMIDGTGAIGKAEQQVRQGGAGKSRGGARRETRTATTDTPVTRIAMAATRALRQGQGANRIDMEALRGVLAGDIPWTERDEDEGTAARRRTRRMAEGIKKVQRAAADLLRGWHEVADEEVAQRASDEAMRKLTGPMMGAWIVLNKPMWHMDAHGRRQIGAPTEAGADAATAEDEPNADAAGRDGKGLRNMQNMGRKKSGEQEPRGFTLAGALITHMRWRMRDKGCDGWGDRRHGIRKNEKGSMEQDATREEAEEEDRGEGAREGQGQQSTGETARERQEEQNTQAGHGGDGTPERE